MKCESCGTEIRGGVKKCPLCGNKVDYSAQIAEKEEQHQLYGGKASQKTNQSVKTAQVYTCPRCHAERSPMHAFCRNCGFEFSASNKSSETVRKVSLAIKIIAIVCVVLCFFPISTWKLAGQSESVSVYKFIDMIYLSSDAQENAAYADELDKTVGLCSVATLAFSVAVAILSFMEIDRKKRYIIFIVLGFLTALCVYEIKSSINDALGMWINVSWGIFYILLLLGALGIGALGIVNLCIDKDA